MKSETALTNSFAAATLSAEKWVALHVPRFANARSAYLKYCVFLEEVLREACRGLGCAPVLEVRAKSVASYAEKILRKRAKYQDARDPLPPDPLLRITDLCGGRVICQTAAEVRAVCAFIERAFAVDRANSEDASQRLKPMEFGYRSVHYVVQVSPEALREAGLKRSIPRELLGFAPAFLGGHVANRPLKAEIQVRTLLEHVSSGIAHDAIYKTELRIPDRVRREFGALAAVLEKADRDCAQLLAEFEAFRSNSGAWRSPETVAAEVAHARVLLNLDQKQFPIGDKLPVAARAGQLALSAGRHQEAVALLEPFAGQNHAGIQRVLGSALVEFHWDDPKSQGYERGSKHLKRAAELAPSDAETLSLMAECATNEHRDNEARELFCRAVAVDGTEPVSLTRFLEFETAHHGTDRPIRLAAPMIRSALKRAEHQIEVGANLAAAWSAKAMAHCYLQEPFAALHAIAQVVRLCRNPAPSGSISGVPFGGAERALFRLRDSFVRLAGIRRLLDGYPWLERFLLLVLACRLKDAAAAAQLRQLASWTGFPDRISARRLKVAQPPFEPGKNVVIVAGGCEAHLEPYVRGFGEQMLRACRGLSFNLISGGTSAGVSGVAGTVAAKSKRSIRALGYVPGDRQIEADTSRFDWIFSARNSPDFTPLDPLQAWTDLFAANVEAAEVKVVCYAPGEIARAECAIALALGARVGLVTDPVLPRDRGFDASAWEGHSALLPLPKDAMTLRAFLQIEHRPVSPEDRRRLEPAARLAHEDYVRSATPKTPETQPWENLPESLKESNYHQVLYWESALRDFGFGIRPLTRERAKSSPIDMERVLTTKQIQEMAELEHGRWNVERLARDWRWSAGPKDINRKLNPCLLPWPEIKNINGTDYQPYDLNVVRELPRKFREVGLDLYRTSRGTKAR